MAKPTRAASSLTVSREMAETDETARQIYPLVPLQAHLAGFYPSLQELADYFDADWHRYCDDPEWLAEAARMLQERKMIDAGVVPPWFKQRTVCTHCGPVLVEGPIPNEKIVGCPWCHGKHKPAFI